MSTLIASQTSGLRRFTHAATTVAAAGLLLAAANFQPEICGSVLGRVCA